MQKFWMMNIQEKIESDCQYYYLVQLGDNDIVSDYQYYYLVQLGGNDKPFGSNDSIKAELVMMCTSN